MPESTINLVLGIGTVIGWAAAVAAYFVGRGKREQANEDADKSHDQRIADLEERATRHNLELGRLTDIAASLNTIIARQDEKITGLARWTEAIDDRVQYMERGAGGHTAKAGGR